MNLGDSRAQSQAQTISHEKHHCDAGEDACFSVLHASITGSYSLQQEREACAKKPEQDIIQLDIVE